MKITYKSICALALTGVMAITATSCSDFLEEYSQDLSKVESWTDLDEVLLGDAYFTPQTFSGNKDQLAILHYMSDEMSLIIDYDVQYSYRYPDYENMFAFTTWMADTGISHKRDYKGGDEVYWNDLYKRINVCNMVLELIDEQPEDHVGDDLEKIRVKGEACFLRSAYYFFLANLYGKPYVPSTADTDLGVPVKLTGSIEDVEFERNALSAVYKQVLDDLAVAEACLSQTTSKSVYRADITAAYMLHSRVALYMQDWENAAKYAEKVLERNNSLLSLSTKSPGNECVYKDSPETIFSSGSYTIATNSADIEGWWGDYPPTCTVSNDMISLYGDDDLRRNLYIGTSDRMEYDNVFTKVNGQYNNISQYCPVSSTFLLRTPEAYLNYAEAMAYMGKDIEACTMLDKFLKTRMSSRDNLSLSGNDLIEFIREERAREFLLEGHRWFDLRRYTVCEPYPWSKTITHNYPFYGKYEISYIESYVLEKNDAAYTLPIPRSIRNFQLSLGNNVRPDRHATKYYPDDDDDDDDDW